MVIVNDPLSWYDRRIKVIKTHNSSWIIAYTSGTLEDLRIMNTRSPLHRTSSKKSHLKDNCKSQIHEMLFIDRGTGLIISSDNHNLEYYPLALENALYPSNLILGSPVALKIQNHYPCHVSYHSMSNRIASCINMRDQNAGSLQLFQLGNNDGQFHFINEWNAISPIGIQKSIFISSHELILMPLAYLQSSTILYHLDIRSSKPTGISPSFIDNRADTCPVIHSISCIPGRPNLIVTGDNNSMICIWDLRKMNQPCFVSNLNCSDKFQYLVTDLLVHQSNLYATTCKGQIYESNFDIYRYDSEQSNSFYSNINSFEPPLASDGGEFLFGIKESDTDGIIPIAYNGAFQCQ